MSIGGQNLVLFDRPSSGGGGLKRAQLNMSDLRNFRRSAQRQGTTTSRLLGREQTNVRGEDPVKPQILTGQGVGVSRLRKE